jgi:hypothetical protein
MKKEYFLLDDKIKEIESKFTQSGWVKIYENTSINVNDQTGIYCCLIDQKIKRQSEDSYSWPLMMGYEGRPTVYGDYTYKSQGKEGIEPFLFYRSFPLLEKNERFFDVSEEFILYFNLYEKAESKQNRKYYYIDEVGNLDEVIIIEPKLIKVRLKYLKEYITLREMHFIISFDFMRLIPETSKEKDITLFDKTQKESGWIYNHVIREIDSRVQSWIIGKVIIDPNPEKKSHYDLDNKYESFITGYDEDGNEVLEDCSKTDGKHLKLTFFKKEVLNKYYNEPLKYEVSGFGIHCKYFSLKVDNNVEAYVPVFLTDLSGLPYKEQLHWKQYNIPRQDGMAMSSTYYKTMIEGDWAEHPETADLFFKFKYKDFNDKWKKKFGWEFYKPLSDKDKHLFKALHVPTTNNVKAFCEQMLSIVKLTIDRLNEKKLQENLTLQEGDKGITKLEKFLHYNQIRIPDMIEFLRNLQSLRSGLMAHTFSNSDKDCKRAIQYFNITEDNYIEVSKDIFQKSIFTLNTLETRFELNKLA